jgi:hypothetical protein
LVCRAMALLLAFLPAYAGPAAVGSVANVALAVVFRLVLSRRAPRLRSRVAVCLFAGVLGGLIALTEALVFVEMRGLQKEPAGFALFFLPVFLAPTAVAALTWVLGDSTFAHGWRSGWALVGAVAGAAASTPALISAIHLTNLSWALWSSVPWELSSFVYWSLFGLPVALAATFGSLLATRMCAAVARFGRAPSN